MTSNRRGQRNPRPPSARRSTGRPIQDSPPQTHDNIHWGDTTLNHSPNHLRIGFLNVGRLPPSSPHPKQDALHHTFHQYHIDILGISEIGLNWTRTRRSHSWQERTFGIFRQQSTTLAWNHHDIGNSPTQWGGVALTTTGLTTSRIQSKGTDPRQLGRWCWTSYSGKKSTTLTIYSIYRPVPNNEGPLSVYQQQRRHLLASDVSTEPLHQWTEDLRQELQPRINQGEHLIVGGDFNSCLRSATFFKMLQELGLQESILSLHSTTPPTFSSCIRSAKSKIIDGIYSSPSIRIQKGGYTPFDTWDHRMVWIDIDIPSTFGSEPTHVPTMGRRLKLQEPETVKKYLQHLLSSIQQTSLLQRARNLNSQVKFTLTVLQQRELESIDHARTLAMLAAEKQCRKLRMGKVPYSPRAIRHALAKSFWKLLLRKRRGHKVSSRLLQRKRHQAHIPTQPFDILTEEQILSNIQECHEEWKIAKSQATSLRQQFLERKAQEASSTTVSKAQALRRLLRLEQERRNHRHIRYTLHGSRSPGLSYVIGPPDAQGNRPHHTTSDEIVQCCMEANSAKYRQTESTPFMTHPLSTDLGFDGLSPQSKAILSGSYPTTSLPHHTALHIQALAQPPNINQWPPHLLHITPKEHAAAWRKAKEKTSSSPSGLHFGMWKANATEPSLCELDAIMRSIPFRTGYAMHRWRQGIDVELHKEPGNHNIERMRTIVLIEADHNMNNKLLGRRAMAYGELHDAIAPEQYGSRKNMSASQASVNNRLMYDLMRQTRQGGIICANDAKSCYDRIVHSVLSLSLQRLGVPPAPIQSMLTTIQKMQHRIKTAHGVSPQFYQSAPSRPPLQGIIQGHGAAPTGWGMTSTPIINALRHAGYGFTHQSAISQTPTHIACTSFVDDTDLWLSEIPDSPPTSTLSRAQAMLDLWNGLLHSTGGALVAHKSHWHWIAFQWNGKQWVYQDPPPSFNNLTILNYDTGQREPLLLLPHHEGRRTLGVHLRPDGSDDATFQALLSKSTAWASRLRSHPLPPATSWLALNTTLMKTLEYPLPSTTLTPKQCQQILWPALQIALPMSKIQRRIPRTLLHSPISTMGMGLPSLYLTQLYSHIMVLLRHGHTPTTTGQLLRASMELLRLELGTDHFPLNLPWHKWGHLATPTWLTATWQSLTEQGLSITDTLDSPTPLRTLDIPFMEFFVPRINNPGLLRHLNRCRMHLHIFWLSEVLTTNGKQLDPSILRGQRSLSWASRCHWPPQGSFLPSDWMLWHSTLLTHLCHIPTRPTSPVNCQLGQYTHHWSDPHYAQHQWLSVWHPPSDRIYRRLPGTQDWQQWLRLPTGRRTRRYQPGPACPTHDVPMESLRASVQTLSPNRLLLLHADPDPVPPATLPSPTTLPPLPRPLPPLVSSTDLQTFIGSHHMDVRWPLQHFTLSSPHTILPHSILAGTLKIVSDGSWKQPHGSAAVLFGDTRYPTVICAQGAHLTPPPHPPPLAGSSYRSEIGGIVSGLLFIKLMNDLYQFPHGGATFACDSLGALQQVFGPHELRPQQSDYDLLSTARDLLATIPHLSLHHRHVRGHQDDLLPFSSLDHWSQWNVRADSIAKQHLRLRAILPSHQPYLRVHTDRWQLWSSPNKAWSTLRPTLFHHHCTLAAIRSLWHKTRSIPRSHAPDIDWPGLSTAMQDAPLRTRRWISKFNTEHCGVASTLLRWRETESAVCPRCPHTPETTSHVLQCHGQHSDTIWNRSLNRLAQTLYRQHTDPELISTLINGLRTWHSGSPPQCYSTNPILRQAFSAQTSIGWENALRGFLSHHWRATQALYRQSLLHDRHFATNRWISALIRALWNTAWDQWDYRNSILHTPHLTHHQALVQQLDSAITQEYNRGTAHLSALSARLFRRPLSSLLARPLRYRQHWLHSVETARQAAHRHLSASPASYRPERQALRRWLHTGRVTILP